MWTAGMMHSNVAHYHRSPHDALRNTVCERETAEVLPNVFVCIKRVGLLLGSECVGLCV